MRFLVIAMAAALFLPSAIVPAQAGAAHATKAASIDLSAKKHKKKMAKTVAKPKKEKVEYMRAAPM